MTYKVWFAWLCLKDACRTLTGISCLDSVHVRVLKANRRDSNDIVLHSEYASLSSEHKG